MATIQVNDDWRLKSDKYCWHAQKYREPPAESREGKKREPWVSETYHPTIADALVWLCERVQRDSDATTVQGLRDEVMSLLADWRKAAQDLEGLTVVIKEPK